MHSLSSNVRWLPAEIQEMHVAAGRLIIEYWTHRRLDSINVHNTQRA